MIWGRYWRYFGFVLGYLIYVGFIRVYEKLFVGL